MEKIEELAIGFIKARRDKLKEKAARSECVNECTRDGEPGEIKEPCYRDKPKTKWCAACKKGNKHHLKFRKLSAKASGLLVRLENAVKERWNRVI